MRLIYAAPLALAVMPALAGDTESGKSKLESVSIGEHWYGPNWSADDLKGRVVLIDYWGQH